MGWLHDHIFELLTAIVAVYGAWLATLTHFSSQREKQRTIGAKISIGFLTFGPRLSDPHLLLHAANPGHVSVTLRSACIKLPDGWQLIVPPGQAENRLPYDLAAGGGTHFWVDLRETALALREHGVRGKIGIRAAFGDAVGVEYLSKPLDFDVDEWLKPKA